MSAACVPCPKKILGKYYIYFKKETIKKHHLYAALLFFNLFIQWIHGFEIRFHVAYHIYILTVVHVKYVLGFLFFKARSITCNYNNNALISIGIVWISYKDFFRNRFSVVCMYMYPRSTYTIHLFLSLNETPIWQWFYNYRVTNILLLIFLIHCNHFDGKADKKYFFQACYLIPSGNYCFLSNQWNGKCFEL